MCQRLGVFALHHNDLIVNLVILTTTKLGTLDMGYSTVFSWDNKRHRQDYLRPVSFPPVVFEERMTSDFDRPKSSVEAFTNKETGL